MLDQQRCDAPIVASGLPLSTRAAKSEPRAREGVSEGLNIECGRRGRRRSILRAVRILLTGFEPWRGQRRNPSGEVALALGGHVLPVRYGAAARTLARLVKSTRPQAILLLGLAPGRRRIGLEAIALNIDHCEEGEERRWSRPVRKRGPMVLRTRLPIERLHRRLRAARIPVSISHHAGTFICNHVFYGALFETRVPCGFVHLPSEAVIPLGRQVGAVRLILAEIERVAR